MKGEQARALEVSPGRVVELQIRETGVGIPADVPGRIFEPFVTTTPEGAATGRGRSMVYGFVRQSGGTVTMLSRAPHRGSRDTLPVLCRRG